MQFNASDPRNPNTMPAGRGLAWLTGSMLLLRAQPIRLLLFGLILQSLAGLTQAGVLGVVFVLGIPALTAGMMQAMRVTDHGMRPPFAVLFSAFARPDRLLRLVALGGLMLAGGMVAIMLVLSGTVAGLDPDVLARLERGEVEALLSVDPGILERLMLAMLAGLIVSGSISYFAVPLVWFHDLPLGAAIRSGLLGLVRNWRPFLVLALLLAVLALPVAIGSAVLLTVNAAGSTASPLLTLAMLVVMVVFQLVLFATQYVAFRDIFGTGEAAGTAVSGEGQLVA